MCAESGRTVRGFHYLDEAAQVLGVRVRVRVRHKDETAQETATAGTAGSDDNKGSA